MLLILWTLVACDLEMPYQLSNNNNFCGLKVAARIQVYAIESSLLNSIYYNEVTTSN